MILSCICIVLLVGVDQFIKYWAVHTLQPQGSIPFIKIGGKEVLNLTYLENQGAAFSSFSGMRWFLIAVRLIDGNLCSAHGEIPKAFQDDSDLFRIDYCGRCWKPD